MPRYIDADELRDDIDNYDFTEYADYSNVIDMIDDAPTVDVQEVKHGHWIDKGVLENYPRPDINVYHLLWCSECGALHRVRHYCEGGWINANYCPNCGAKMDGGAEQ